MPNGDDIDWPTDIENRVQVLRRDVDDIQECVSGMDKKLDNLQKQIWYMALIIVAVLGTLDKIPLFIRVLGGG